MNAMGRFCAKRRWAVWVTAFPMVFACALAINMRKAFVWAFLDAVDEVRKMIDELESRL